jgi:hypothetical protein
MDLDHGSGKCSQCIVKAPGIVGESTSVDDDRIVIVSGSVNGFDDLAFGIALNILYRKSDLGSLRSDSLDVFLECGSTINLRFTFTKKVEIRTMNQHERVHDGDPIS